VFRKLCDYNCGVADDGDRLIGVRMYKVQIEKADGEVYFIKDGKQYEEEFAGELMEYLWNTQGHTGNYASFRMIDEDGEVHAELEC
jgi:hypothetical protein